MKIKPALVPIWDGIRHKLEKLNIKTGNRS